MDILSFGLESAYQGDAPGGVLERNLEALARTSPSACARIRATPARTDVQFIETDEDALSARLLGDGDGGRLKAGLVVLVVAGLLAGGIALIGGMVQTPREALMDRTRALVTALAELDRASLHTMLDPEAEVQVRGRSSFRGRELILSTADRYVGNGAISSHAIPEVQGVIDGVNAARTQVRVRHSGSVPPASWWRITWYRASEGEPWTAVKIEPLWISGLGNL